MASDPPPGPDSTTLPLHAAMLDADGRPLRIHRRVGGPTRARLAPDADEQTWILWTGERRRRHVDADPLVGALRDRQPAEDVLQEVKIGLAVESASLKFEIEHAGSEGKDVAQLSTRRIDSLHKLGLVLLGERRVGIEAPIDPKALATLQTIWIDTVTEVARATLPEKEAERLLSTYVQRLEAGEPKREEPRNR